MPWDVIRFSSVFFPQGLVTLVIDEGKATRTSSKKEQKKKKKTNTSAAVIATPLKLSFNIALDLGFNTLAFNIDFNIVPLQGLGYRQAGAIRAVLSTSAINRHVTTLRASPMSARTAYLPI